MKRLVLAMTAVLAMPALAVELPEALRAARGVDPTVASAAANRDAARENVDIARARLLPQMNFQTSAQRLRQTTTQAGVDRDFTGQSHSTQLSVRQAIYRPKDWIGVDIGRLQAEYGELKLASATSDLQDRGLTAWVDVLLAQELRDLYARTVDHVAVSAEQERRRFAAGDGTRDAMVEAAAQLSLARAQLAEADLTLAARLKSFNLLTRLNAKDFRGFRLPQAHGLAVLPEVADTMLERILASNPELLALRISELVAERRLAQAGADHKPTLDLVGSANRNSNDNTFTLGTKYQNTQVGLQFVLPIYSGGGVNAAQRQSTAAHAAATADREALTQRIETQFGEDWNAQGGLLERARAAVELVKAGREQRRAIELGIKAGVKTWADLGASELMLSRRESDSHTAVAQVLKTQARLLALLPVTDEAWDRWTQTVSGLSRP